MGVNTSEYKFFITILLVIATKFINSQTVLNGGFESWPPGCPYNTVPNNWVNFSTYLAPDQAGCAGSVVSIEGNSHMNLVWSTVGFTNGLYEGAQQTIPNLVIGKNYQVSFYAINDQGLYSNPGTPVILDFYLDSNVVFSSPELFSGGPWTAYSVNFIAASSSVTIGFKAAAGTTNTNGSLGIDDVSISETTNIQTIMKDDFFSVYPNPFEEEFFVRVENTNFNQASYTLVNVLGEILLNELELDHINTQKIDLRKLPDGVYFICLTVDGKQSCRKIVKK